jgi:NADH:ubiquinone oxidoreductase subunit 5 (subunit L)/multisubunit Na+/H+ antiporter MnhA subunit
VQHWAFRVSSYKAGLKVFSVSQLGDLPFFLFFFAVFARTGTTNVAELLATLPLLAFEYLL